MVNPVDKNIVNCKFYIHQHKSSLYMQCRKENECYIPVEDFSEFI